MVEASPVGISMVISVCTRFCEDNYCRPGSNFRWLEPELPFFYTYNLDSRELTQAITDGVTCSVLTTITEVFTIHPVHALVAFHPRISSLDYITIFF